jgi:hypothetical protein
MAWDKGFNFRATSGYVTDGANETYVINTEVYPITRNSVTFGWTAASAQRASANRSTGVDRRLAGINYLNPPNNSTFQVDLPAPGTYDISMAAGDASDPNHIYAEVYDDTSLLFTVADAAPGAGNFVDANNATYSAANWPANNTARRVVFSSSVLKVLVGNADGSYHVFAHLFVSQVETGPDPSFRVQSFRPAIFSPGIAR